MTIPADALLAPLSRVELFQNLAPSQLDQIARRAERMMFRAGDTIAEAGAGTDAALLIVAGAAEWVSGATDDDNGPAAETIEIGSLIGEMAMFIDYTYGSTIVATGPVKCLKLTRSAMHDLMLEYPELAESMTAKIAQRLTRVANELRVIDQNFIAAIPEFAYAAGGTARAAAVH